MLQLNNITINLSQTGRALIEDFSFTLKPGEKAVIIGEEGNGKSTLLKFIYDGRMIENYCEYSGNVIKRGVMAYLPQTMEGKSLEMTVDQYFADADIYSHTGVLDRMGLSLDFLLSPQSIQTLSGGEKVKIQLARLLMEEPDILILDEPTNDLDLETLEWIQEFIASAKQSVLFVSHDETLIEHTANVIIHLEQLGGKKTCRATVARSCYQVYMEERACGFQRQSQIAEKQRDEYYKKQAKWQKLYNQVEYQQDTITRQNPAGGRLLKKKMKSVLAQGKRFEREAEEFLDLPQMELAIFTSFNQDIRVPKTKMILDFSLPELNVQNRILARGVQLYVAGDQHVGIIGRNGVGKSTLLQEIWRELENRKDIISAFMPQDYSQRLDYHQSAVEFLTAHYDKEQVTRACTYMGSMRFTYEEMNGKIGCLSGGQKAKLLFLDMVLKNANVLILDEPTRNFSPLSGPVVRDALKNFGGAIISISHDRKYLQEVCEIVYRLTENGLVLEKGILK